MTDCLKRNLLVALFFLPNYFGSLNQVSAAEYLVLPEIAQISNTISEPKPHIDNLDSSWWQTKVKAQATASQGKHYRGCLFGDSISRGIGNTLGEHTFNFGMGGLSSVSLVEQLKRLSNANVRCHKAIIAVGTNDAWYETSDDLFIKKMRRAISLVRAMGATQVTLIPAFYSTLAASHDPNRAGTIQRVKEINVLMHQVAETAEVPIETEGLQSLYRKHLLRTDLTFDGVHLNEEGRQIYRRVLLRILAN